MGEPLKKEDMIRGVIVNADEYKKNGIISPNKIEEVWINLENHKSAVEFLKSRRRKYICKNGVEHTEEPVVHW